jgi:hypothetical protein
MIPLDYGRSFLIGKASDNEVRFWVESRTRIIDEASGQFEDYIQVGSCKSEHTFAEKDLLHEDNYDFLPIFGPEWSIVYRRPAALSERYCDIRPSVEWWDGQKYYLVEGQDVAELHSNEMIREATYDFTPIVTQTEIWNEDTGLRAIIECPVKTMNTRREDNIYQVDTGPVALPDLSRRYDRHVDGISLAFVVFNAPHFADFVLEAPTVVGSEQVHHYSKIVSLEAQNRVYAVGG